MVDIVDKALRMGEGRQIKKLEHVAQATDALEDEIAALNDEELKGQTAKFKQRLDNGESLDKLMPEAFATVREASSAPWACATSTCSSWVARRCTGATSPK